MIKNESLRLPVITLYQPWATYIMKGIKTIETRTHDRFKVLKNKTILIHAGQKIDKKAIELITLDEEIITGAILGSAYVYECRWLTGSEYENKCALVDTTNRYGLFLKDIKLFEKPIFIKGKMGIWYYELNFNEFNI